MPTKPVLLAGLVDYAGLFPPACRDMADAVRQFASDRQGPHAWMLGRFVVPMPRLVEFDRALSALSPEAASTPPWRIAALAGHDLGADVDDLAAYHDGAPHQARAVVDTLEINVSRPEDVDRAAALVPPSIRVVCELPAGCDRPALKTLLDRIADAGGVAKLRTGGVTGDAIPSVEAVASFIWECACAGVPFKATAGLHHAVRGEYSLTYAADSPVALMHGFLNVFVAGALAWMMGTQRPAKGGAPPPERLQAVLDERDLATFSMDADGVRWRDVRVPAADVEAMRSRFALSFGSCSFAEPVADLCAHGILR